MISLPTIYSVAIVPLKSALYTSLNKFMKVPLKFPSIDQNNDRPRRGGKGREGDIGNGMIR
jgi:hypothetical protein